MSEAWEHFEWNASKRLRSTWAAAAGADRLLVLFNALERCFPQRIAYFTVISLYFVNVMNWKSSAHLHFAKTSELLLLQKTNHLHGAHQRKKKNNVFFSNTHWPNLKGTHFIQYFLQPPFASLWKCLIRLEKTSSLLPFFSFREFLFCEGQQSFAAHQKYILWFYSLR